MTKAAFDDVATQAMTEDMEAANEKIKAKRRKYRIKKRDEKREAKQMRKVKAMENVCADFGLDLPATALQFALAHPAIINVIPGLNSAKRVRQTMGYLDVDIPIAFWGALKDQHLIEAAALTPE